MPVLIEVSLLLFFLALCILLSSMNFTVLQVVVWFPAIMLGAYLNITFMPLVQHDSPYYSRYSSFMGFLGHVEKLAAETVRKRASKIDNQIFKWIFDNLTEDHDSEVTQFFESICTSSILQEPLLSLTNMGEGKLSSALSKFVERTWLSNFVSESDKMRRLVVCVKIADVASLSDVALSILEDIFSGHRHKVLRSVEIGRSLTSQGNKAPQEISLCAQCIVAGIISNVQRNDDHWIALAADQLGKSESVVRGYLEHGNESVLLANLIHITRRIFRSSLGDDRDMADASSYVLSSLSNFDIRNTLPGVQHDFLTLWDEIDREAQNNSVPTKICDSLRNLYNALNSGTDGTSTAPPAFNTKLNPYNHPSDSNSPTHEAVNENSHTHIATPLSVSHYDAGLATVTHSPADGATEDTNDTSSMTNPLPQSTLNGGAAPQCNERMTIAPPAPAMVPGSLSSPTFMPAPSSALTGGLHSPPDSAEKGQSDALPHASVASSLDPNLLLSSRRSPSSHAGMTRRISAHRPGQVQKLSRSGDSSWKSQIPSVHMTILRTRTFSFGLNASVTPASQNHQWPIQLPLLCNLRIVVHQRILPSLRMAD
ncbi:hypothetical protein BJV78DRAFT_412369 [Lactifluus subvellereus]|nr:hypothetical protein BJV78DRAFT_412369 [Lactifluus subvellereus]